MVLRALSFILSKKEIYIVWNIKHADAGNPNKNENLGKTPSQAVSVERETKPIFRVNDLN